MLRTLLTECAQDGGRCQGRVGKTRMQTRALGVTTVIHHAFGDCRVLLSENKIADVMVLKLMEFAANEREGRMRNVPEWEGVEHYFTDLAQAVLGVPQTHPRFAEAKAAFYHSHQADGARCSSQRIARAKAAAWSVLDRAPIPLPEPRCAYNLRSRGPP